MWVYQQSSGNLYRHLTISSDKAETGFPGLSSATFLGRGYSGNGKGLNNPDMQNVPDVGPIPCGDWYMGPAYDHPEHGPVTIPLRPEPGTQTFGRDHFLCHGDLKDAPGQFKASKGCMIMPRWIRERMSQSGDHLLRVIR